MQRIREEIKEPNSEILKGLLNLLKTLKYSLSECQKRLNYENISTTQAIQQTLSELLQTEKNNLPKDLRNKAQTLVAEVESLLLALRVLQLCEALKNLPHTAPLTSLDNIILNLEQNQQILSVLLQKKEISYQKI